MGDLRFEWDREKNKQNRRKHGLFMADPDHSDDEDRFVLLGLSSGLRTLVVHSRERKGAMMKRKERRIVMAVVMFCSWAGTAAAQGLYWETTTSGVGDQARTAQNYAMPKMMKIVNANGQVIILRADQEKFISVDTKKQTYREIGFSEMESAAKSMQGQMKAARAQMEKRMKEMPPEQRAMMEKMMPKVPGADAGKSSAVTVTNTGETKTVGGHTCTKQVATQDGKTVLVVWTAKDVKGFEGLRDDWIAYQRRLANTNRMAGTAFVEAYAKIEGFPMATEIGDIKTVVTKVEPRTTAASEFEAPPGYKKESMNLPVPHQ